MSISSLTPLLTAKEVGLIIRRHEKTVLKLAKAGDITCIRQNNGSVEFTEDHVRAYLASREVPAKAAEPTPAPKPTRNPKYGNK